MRSNKAKLFFNTAFWGCIVWLFGYILGIIFFMFIPKNLIGFVILPLGVAFMLWVLLKKIKRESFMCYVSISILWTIIAVAFDYFFIVKLFNSTDYYKLDVDIYYALTFILPMAVGWYKKSKGLIT